MIFSYDIDNIKAYGPDNIVKEARFILTASQDGLTEVSFFPVQFDATNNFTPYNQLTKQDFLDWTISVVGAYQIDALKQGLEAILLQRLADGPRPEPTLVPPPWDVVS